MIWIKRNIIFFKCHFYFFFAKCIFISVDLGKGEIYKITTFLLTYLRHCG